MISRIVKAAALAACLVAPTTAMSQSKPGEYEFTGSQFTWDRGGFVRVFFGVVNDNGKVSVCGINYVKAGGSLKGKSDEMLEGLRVQLNGRSIIKDLRFFTLVRSEEAFQDADVSCQETDVDYPEKVKLKLRSDVNRY